MARIRKVTRTIVSTDVEVKTINTATDVIGSVVITVAGTYNVDDEKEAKALDKAVRKSFVNQKLGDEIVMVSIVETHPVTKWYSMLEDDFIKLAECKVLAEGENAEDEDENEE